MIELTDRVLKKELRDRFSARGHDVTPYQWVILYRLWEQDGESQTELSERTIKDQATISRAIDVLEKKDLIFRENHNRRQYRIFLTDAGRKLQRELPPLVEEHLARALHGVAEEELEVTKRVLQRICNNLGSSYFMPLQIKKTRPNKNRAK
jgi:DNA-binding MarR family transcriptional regulator